MLQTERTWKHSDQKLGIPRAFLVGAWSLPSDYVSTVGLCLATFSSVDISAKNTFWFL